MRATALVTVMIFSALTGAVHAMPNPASAFCITMKGRSVIAQLPEGEAIGLCYLPGNRVVEEWTLFHMFGGQVPKTGHNPFE